MFAVALPVAPVMLLLHNYLLKIPSLLHHLAFCCNRISVGATFHPSAASTASKSMAATVAGIFAIPATTIHRVDIGAWYHCLEFVNVASVVMNCALLYIVPSRLDTILPQEFGQIFSSNVGK